MSKYSEMTTDDLSELLPNNLHAARHDNAPPQDRWRMYNTGSKNYGTKGADSLRNLLILTLEEQDEEREKWMNG